MESSTLLMAPYRLMEEYSNLFSVFFLTLFYEVNNNTANTSVMQNENEQMFAWTGIFTLVFTIEESFTWCIKNPFVV